MTSEEIEALAASDAATLAVVNCLVRFLEAKDVLRRAEFIDFLEQTGRSMESEGANELLRRFFRTAVESIRADKVAPHSLN